MAHQLGSADLLAMVQAGFVHGMDVMLACAGGITAAAAVLMPPPSPGSRRPRTAVKNAASAPTRVKAVRLREIEAAYEHHSAAALALAEERFAGAVVAPRLLADALS